MKIVEECIELLLAVEYSLIHVESYWNKIECIPIRGHVIDHSEGFSASRVQYCKQTQLLLRNSCSVDREKLCIQCTHQIIVVKCMAIDTC